MFNNNKRDEMTNEKKDKFASGLMYRGELELPSTIEADKKHREQLIETLQKGINILRDGNDVDFALGFVKKRLK